MCIRDSQKVVGIVSPCLAPQEGVVLAGGLGLYPCGLIPYQPGKDRRNPRSGKGTRKSRVYRPQQRARRKGTLAGRGLYYLGAAAAQRAGSSPRRRTAAYIGFAYIGKSNIG